MTMTPDRFAVASAIQRVDEATFTVTIPDGWQQGRGAFGGLVLGILTRAVEECEVDPARRVRTVAGDLCGPVLPGAATVSVRTLRRGTHQTNAHAELVQQGVVLATATVVSSTPRPASVAIAPREPPPDED